MLADGTHYLDELVVADSDPNVIKSSQYLRYVTCIHFIACCYNNYVLACTQSK